jgi:hypothetical protein
MQGLSERVARVPADRTVAEVVARLTDIETEIFLPDGVACFNMMYLRVTEAVRDALPTFDNREFIERLDIVFAEFYFEAYAAAAAQAWVSKAWEPLFQRRAEHRMALQFAITGMNAHINNDLAHALVLTWRELGFDSAMRSDYDKVNDILKSVEQDIKGPLSSDLIQEVDTAFGTTDDFLALWSIRHARDQAWERAQIMRHIPGDELDGLFDRIVGFAGNLLLGPAV